MARIFIESYGCSLNKADSQAMVALLGDAGFEIVGKPEDSDIIIVNSCIVKSPTQQKIMKRLGLLKKLKKPIILAGCMPQAMPYDPMLSGFSQIGVNQINSIVEVVIESLAGNTVVLLAKDNDEKLSIPHYSPNSVVDIIPISQGCLGEPCSYCIVKAARGNLRSYPMDEIIRRVREAANRGAKEIWLTAQDTAAYGTDIGKNLPELLNLASAVPGDFLLRLGMGNPNHVLGFIKELIEAMKPQRVFKFIHLPLQSGNNEILNRMRRKYSVEEFEAIVQAFRASLPSITIATDIICGFPGETEAQFEDTLNVVRKVKPDVINISRFWPRPGTEAATFKGFSGNLTKLRSRELTKVFIETAFKVNTKWIGWMGDVLINEQGQNKSWQGRNFAYKPVVVFSEENLLGKRLRVRVFDASAYDLKGKILS